VSFPDDGLATLRFVVAILVALLIAGVQPAFAESPNFNVPPSIIHDGRPAVGKTLRGDYGQWGYLDGSGCGRECRFTFEWYRTNAAGTGWELAHRRAFVSEANGDHLFTLTATEAGRRIMLKILVTKFDCGAPNTQTGAQECRDVTKYADSAPVGPVGSKAGPSPAPTGDGPSSPIPNPCDLPGAGFVCDAVGGLVGDVAGAAGDFVMRGVTVWVTNAAVWVTGKVGELIDATASPDVQSEWFVAQYRSMLAVAAVLALPLLLLAVIQALMRQDAWILLRSAFGYLPMAFILAGAAVVGADLLISITDDLSAMVIRGLGDGSDNLLASVGDAYSRAIEDDSDGAVPLFGIFLGAIILAIGAFVLWLEMVIRDAAIYIGLFFVPLTFIAMIWPATSRYARRLVEFLIAVILAKFVIVAIIGLASAAITNSGAGGGDGDVFERMIAGAALLVLAAWSPFALLRLIPMMEIAAASVVTQRSSISGAANSAGIHSPALYMRQAMDRHSRPSASPAYEATSGTTYSRVHRGAEMSASGPSYERTSERETRSERHTVGGSQSGGASSGRGGTTHASPAPGGPTQAPPAPAGPTHAQPAPGLERGPQSPPPDERRPQPPPPPQPRRPPRPPEPPADRWPPREND
jgi:hypothetical protein